MTDRIIDPFDVRTWPEEARRNHRLRRALHELLPEPGYRVEVGTKPDGTDGIRITHGEVTPDALAFLQAYRDELISHHYWLQQVDQYHGVTEDVPAWKR